MADWRTTARRTAQRYGLDPDVFVRQIQQESGGRDVRSPAGAQGPAQFMPGTARSVGLTPTTVHQLGPSLNAAAKLMKGYVDRYGSYRDALVAYNAGPGRVGGALPAETQNYLKTILGGRTPSTRGVRSTGGGTTTTTTTTTTPDQALALTLKQPAAPTITSPSLPENLTPRGYQPVITTAPTETEGQSELQQKINQLQQQTTTTSELPTTAGLSTGDGPSGAYKARADVINSQRLPYKWGGGHAAKTSIRSAVPLDCSGAVSKVLGIDPRVSGDFQRFGSPGRAPGGKGTTIYANSGHVLMEIDGHFFGTSKTNPQGGAGWIPRSAISKQYLKGFTARHV